MMTNQPFQKINAILLAATLASMSAVSVAAPDDFPKLDDPKLQELLDNVKADYEHYLASGNKHLERPAESKPWPCQVTLAELNKMAGTVDSDDDPFMKRKLENFDRSMESTKPTKRIYNNQTFYPVQASCKGGKLEGPVEFWVELDQRNTGVNVGSHVLAHVRLTAKAGKPYGLVQKVEELSGKNLAFTSSWAGGPADAPDPLVRLLVIDANGTIFRNLHVTRPFGGNRWEETNYDDREFWENISHEFRLKNSYQYKDGKLHGISTKTKDGKDQCWKDGEEIKADPCTVD